MVTREEEPLKSKENTKITLEETKEKTLIEKIRYIKDNITVEPVLACYVIPGVLARLATQNLNLDKACRVNKGYGESVCDALIAREGKYLKEELAVQELIAGMEVWRNILLTAIPSFLILFIGAWSDRTGKRKICILLPIMGDLLMCLSNMLNVYYFYELPLQVTMFFEAILPAITGGWITTYMGIFSYISDVSSEESRTFRVGVANLCLTAGGPIGSALSGILLKQIGYYGVFSLSSILFMFSILYGIFCVKEPGKPPPEKAVEGPSGIIGFLKTFFDVKHVKETLSVTFKKGPNRRRTKAILVFAAIAFIYGPASGEFTVRYLFTRYRFNWDALKYSFYQTFYICIHALGALISISLFSRRFQWHDSILGLISSMSKFVGGLSTGLARNNLEMYLAVVVETFNATSFTALRSISSKLVTSDELGKMISLFNLMEVLTSMVFGPVFSWIYMVTLPFDAGFIYYVSTALTVPSILIFIWFYRQHRKDSRLTEDGKDGEAMNEEDGKNKKRDSISKRHSDVEDIKDVLVNSIHLADEKIFLE